MMSRHFALSSELTGAIAKRLPHAKNQLSAPGSFFNQFVTEIYIYIQSTPLNRVTSVRAYFAPIKRRTLLTEKKFVLASMCESYSGPAKMARLSG